MEAANGEHDLVVIRVKCDDLALFPDANFIAWCLHHEQPERELQDLMVDIDLAAWRDMWQQSLTRNGVVCTPSVPPSAILEYRSIEVSNWELLLSIGGEAILTPAGYRALGQHYERCIAALFEDGEEAALHVSRERLANLLNTAERVAPVEDGERAA